MKDAFLKFDALLTREDVLAILKEKKQSKESKEQLAGKKKKKKKISFYIYTGF